MIILEDKDLFPNQNKKVFGKLDENTLWFDILIFCQLIVLSESYQFNQFSPKKIEIFFRKTNANDFKCESNEMLLKNEKNTNSFFLFFFFLVAERDGSYTITE